MTPLAPHRGPLPQEERGPFFTAGEHRSRNAAAILERAQAGVEGEIRHSRKGRGRPALWTATLVAALTLTPGALAHKAGGDTRLPKIGPAPEFTLTNQDGKRLSLRDLRGQVTVVTFIFTTCSDTCPLLTAKLIGIQRQLGVDASKVSFAAITVDPLNDTPAVLKKYGQAHSADLSRFSFLTGSLDEIGDVTRRYAVFQQKQPSGSVEHTFLTSIIDQSGTLRVQYLGVRFDPKEFLGDVRSLLAEAGQR